MTFLLITIPLINIMFNVIEYSDVISVNIDLLFITKNYILLFIIGLFTPSPVNLMFVGSSLIEN